MYHDEFKLSPPKDKYSIFGMSKRDSVGGMIGGIGGVVDMAIDNEQAAQPYTANTTSALNPNQEAFANQFYGQAMPQIGQPGRSYQGQRVADMSSLQQQGFGLAGQTPGLAGPIYGGAQNIMQNLSQDPSQMFQPVANAAFNTFQNRIAPDIMNRFSNTGSADSGMAQQTLGRAGTDLSTQLFGQLASMQQQAMGNQISALPQMANFAQLPTQMGAQMASLGGQQRGIGQEYLTANQQRFNEQDPSKNPWLALGLNTLPSSGQFQDTAMLQQPVSQNEALAGSMKSAFDPFDWF